MPLLLLSLDQCMHTLINVRQMISMHRCRLTIWGAWSPESGSGARNWPKLAETGPGQGPGRGGPEAQIGGPGRPGPESAESAEIGVSGRNPKMGARKPNLQVQARLLSMF